MAKKLEGMDSPLYRYVAHSTEDLIGFGTFGVVTKAKLKATGETVAIKKVRLNRALKNREWQLMSLLNHCNIIKLRNFYYTTDTTGINIHTHFVLDYMPKTLLDLMMAAKCEGTDLPLIQIKLYMFQLFRALAYLHKLIICHRDVKPTNLLVDPTTGVLKLCDFGSAKQLNENENNVSIVGNCRYRAPELLLLSRRYTTKIDIWSAGCLLAELLLGDVLFQGMTQPQQTVKIFTILGRPTEEQFNDMRPDCDGIDVSVPPAKARPWQQIFSPATDEDGIILVSRLLDYSPLVRITALRACTYEFFHELRDKSIRLPSGRSLPPLFSFTSEELITEPSLASNLTLMNKTEAVIEHSMAVNIVRQRASVSFEVTQPGPS